MAIFNSYVTNYQIIHHNIHHDILLHTTTIWSQSP
jgi:hypothetical protein